MRKLILLALTLSHTWVGAQTLRDSVHVDNGLFTIVYSEVLQQPKSVRYQVKCTGAGVSRAGMDFYVPPGLVTSDNADYVNNQWDKGHMAPAASFNCTPQMLKATFTYANSALQQESLNRGPWRLLELEERKIAAQTPVRVFIRVDFAPNPRQLPTGATIPSGFYKEVIYGNSKVCYYFPNTKPTTSDFSTFKCKCRN